MTDMVEKYNSTSAQYHLHGTFMGSTYFGFLSRCDVSWFTENLTSRLVTVRSCEGTNNLLALFYIFLYIIGFTFVI